MKLNDMLLIRNLLVSFHLLHPSLSNLHRSIHQSIPPLPPSIPQSSLLHPS